MEEGGGGDGGGVLAPSRGQQLVTYFRHPEYLSAIGGQLTASNILDYFRYSSFYEQDCNNAILQMQNTADLSSLLQWDPQRLEEELKRFVGVEYVVVHAMPPDLFVIHQRWRSSPTQTKVLECFYVLHGNIQMAADIYTILGSKLLTAVSGLSSSLSLVRETQTTFNPREGHAWRIAAEAETNSGDEDEEGEGMQAASSNPSDQTSKVPSLLVTDQTD